MVELGADVAELRGTRGRKAAPPGLMPLKAAASATGYSYETCRRWSAQFGKEIGAVRVGGFWFVDAAALAAKIKRTARARMSALPP